MSNPPLNAIHPHRGGTLELVIYDPVKWGGISELEKKEFYDTAMMYGRVEVHRRYPVATITRTQEARLDG